MLIRFSISFLLISCIVLTGNTISARPGPIDPECDFPCPDNWDPVCGTDCRTYSNICEFERGQCLNESLELKNIGECAKQI